MKNDEAKREICVVVGTRPGIIMMAPVIHELVKKSIPHYVVHTGQHYSPFMDKELFEDLNLTKPAFHLENINIRHTHGSQTAVMLEGCEKAFLERRPSLVLVNGDANTNLAAALAARKLGIRLGHIEAGERSYDWRMPEEHNRRMMDHISELLFATNDKAANILRKENVPGRIHVTGNTIADASMNHARIAYRDSALLDQLGVEKERYVIVTSHREENVDTVERLRAILQSTDMIARTTNLPVLFLAHPRTRKRIVEFGLESEAESYEGVRLLEPLRYLQFMQLLVKSRIVITDSGGVQQEAYIHKRPCVTMRDNTEWVETLRNGGNRLSGADNPGTITARALEALQLGQRDWPEIFGDGKAAQRIVGLSQSYINDRSVQ